MPFTPFHFGPGLLIKSFLKKNFNLTTFILIQIVIDLEVLWNLWRDHERLHAFFHSYVGASVIMLVFILIMPFFYAQLSQNFRYISIITGAVIGAWSHVFLDSLMHADLLPWFPFRSDNFMLNKISLLSLHLGCVFSALMGSVILILVHKKK